ncbi:hypothetical protein LEP3755_01560 [Leptolyngbya sp. NIES-3755]|nr:hypothetical protein LEP3755_01560 [Leptolyngbya sp. NIES-3755]
MDDLLANRIRRLENQVNAVVTQLSRTNTDLIELYGELHNCYDPDSSRAIELEKKIEIIQIRIQALSTLTPREVRY